MQGMSLTLDGDDVLTVERDGQWVTSGLPQPDPNWRATDSNGHEHAYSESDVRYPTLKLVWGEPYWCADCCDEHRDSWYECRQCGEEVKPGTRVDLTPKWIPGATTYLLNDEPISHEYANELIAEMQQRADVSAQIAERPTIGARVRLDDATVTVMPTDVDVPDDQVTVMFDGTGVMETVTLDRLRKLR